MRRLNKPYIVRLFHRLTGRRSKLNLFWSDLAPKTLFVDVGASYFYNKNWIQATRLPSSTFIQIDPNLENLDYIDKNPVDAKVYKVPLALSGGGGERTLYVTNVDSGSTLFKPWISPDFEPRLSSEIYSYFFPLEEKTITTHTLESVIPIEAQDTPTVLKLDAQGSELEILRGSESVLRRQVLAIEVEASLLRHPFAKDGTKFADVQLFLESLGFELVNLDLLYSHGPTAPKDIARRGYLNECDALFVLNHREIQMRDIDSKLSAFFILSLYGQSRDCIKLLEGDLALRDALYAAAGGSEQLKKILVTQEKSKF